MPLKVERALACERLMEYGVFDEVTVSWEILPPPNRVTSHKSHRIESHGICRCPMLDAAELRSPRLAVDRGRDHRGLRQRRREVDAARHLVLRRWKTH